jgi:DNA invertase Pin-like site-specific DNA recombinase
MARRSILSAAGATGAPRFVAYYRVSTDKQGASGLGLEAQRAAVERHVAGAGGLLVAEFTEVETGTNKRHRPKMAEALAACRLRRAVLIIAKLDRLARNVHFISGLMESGVDFIACDNPHATRVLIHVMAAFAEHEAEMISARTKAALAAAKARGVKLGNPNLRRGCRGEAVHAARVRRDLADEYAADIAPYIDRARRAGCTSLGDLARALSAVGVKTPAGGDTWSREQVRRILTRNQRATA